MKTKRGLKSKFSKFLSIKNKYIKKHCLTVKKKRKDTLPLDVVKNITDYYRLEQHCTTLPNVKNVKCNEPLVILQRNVKDIYDEFLKESNIKVSFSKFSALRPKNVKSAQKLVQCLCEPCENISLKLKLIIHVCDSKLKDKYELLNKTLCDKGENEWHKLECINRNCEKCGTKEFIEDIFRNLNKSNEVLNWTNWDMVEVKNPKNNSLIKKRQVISKEGTVDEFKKEICDELDVLSRHLFVARWQHKQFRLLIDKCPKESVVITIDFAENYTCFNQYEVQGAHWAKDAATIHPSIVVYRCPKCRDDHTVEEAVDIISDDLNHDASAVNTFLEKIFDHLKLQGVVFNKAFILSDGCAAQYKCKSAFLDTSLAKDEFGITIERGYYGSRHGKNRCDGEGGVVKSKAARAVKNNEAVINNAFELYNYLKTAVENQVTGSDGDCKETRRKILWIPKEEINHDRQEQFKTVVGTRKFHSVCGVRAGQIKTRELSCYCDSCSNKDEVNAEICTCTNFAYTNNCKEYTLKSITGKPLESNVEDNNLNILSTSSLEVLTADSIDISDQTIKEIFRSSSENRNRISPGQFVVAILPFGKRTKEYVAEINNVLDVQDHEVNLNYMEERQSWYVWPSVRDTSWENTSSIKKVVQTPILNETASTNRQQIYNLRE